jgi:hypothetical protein
MNPEFRWKQVVRDDAPKYGVLGRDGIMVLQVRYPVEPLNPLNDDMTEWQDVPVEE